MKKPANNRKRNYIVFAVVAALLVVQGSAQSIDGFSLYDPFDNINLVWADQHAQYPYRTILMGAEKTGSYTYNSQFYAIYSKQPTTDLFKFRYDNKSVVGQFERTEAERRGYITAYFNWEEYIDLVNRSQLKIVKFGLGSVRKDWSGDSLIDARLNDGLPTMLDFIGVTGNLMRGGTYDYYPATDKIENVYIEFDFYYDCASEHEFGDIEDLQITGLNAVANVPYDYIIACLDVHGPGGGGSGIDPPGGKDLPGSGDDEPPDPPPGGGNSNDRDGDGLPDNNDGDNGRPGWGGGDYGGGVDRDDINDPPDYWQDPIEDDYTENLRPYEPEYPEYEPGEGDTGENGASWELPSFDFDNIGFEGEPSGYKDFTADGEQGLIPFEPGGEQNNAEFVAGGEYGLIDFMNPQGGTI